MKKCRLVFAVLFAVLAFSCGNGAAKEVPETDGPGAVEVPETASGAEQAGAPGRTLWQQTGDGLWSWTPGAVSGGAQSADGAFDGTWKLSVSYRYTGPAENKGMLTWTGVDGKKAEFDFFPKRDPGPLVFYSEWREAPREITLGAGADFIPLNVTIEPRRGESPTMPLVADLGTMLHTPRKNWRNGEYEIFAFNRFPDMIYIFSNSNTVQSLFLRRLAFFVEKRGFVGRLARDEEIQELRDWGAHDYKSADLARFFQKAAEERFPLNSHELLLKEILLSNGIIRQEGPAIVEGKGALIGMSLGISADRLPYYLIHETVHGLCFTLPELRTVFRAFYHSLSDIEKSYLKSAFDYREYNVLEDEDLLITETAAYLLQQAPPDTPAYYERTISYWFDHSPSEQKGEWADFLAKNPDIFERRSAFLQQKLWEITGFRAENFFDLLPKDRAL